MENSTLSELFVKVIHFVPHNSSYVISGTFDVATVDATWILSATIFFFTMQTGLALLEVGSVQPKNQANVMMKHLVDVCFGGFVYWIIGFGLMYGRGEFTNGFFGFGDFAVNAHVSDPLSSQILLFFFFQISFSCTSSTIFSAAVSERINYKAYIPLSMSVVLIYSITAGWIWGDHGFLKNMGVVDFAGSAPIHLIAGTASLVGAWYIGPRKGRFDLGIDPLPLSNPVLFCTGLFILWWGWIGFNCGSSYGVSGEKIEFAARAGAATIICSICAGLCGIIISMIKHKGKSSVSEVVGCVLAGLVAINSGCNIFSTYASGIVGFLAAVFYFTFSRVTYRLKIDDVCDVVAIHFVNGIWGHLSVGLFGDPSSGPKSLFINGSFFRLKVQFISCLFLIGFTAIIFYLIMKIVDHFIGIRMDEDAELIGADKYEHEIEDSTPILHKMENNINLDLDSLTQIDSIPWKRNQYHVNQGFQTQ